MTTKQKPLQPGNTLNYPTSRVAESNELNVNDLVHWITPSEFYHELRNSNTIDTVEI